MAQVSAGFIGFRQKSQAPLEYLRNQEKGVQNEHNLQSPLKLIYLFFSLSRN